MDVQLALRGRNLNRNWKGIAQYYVQHSNQIGELIAFCEHDEVIIQQNAGAVLGKLIDHDKNILDIHVCQLVQLLQKEVHDAVKRAVLRVLQFAQLNEDCLGELFDFIIQALASQTDPIAIKAFGMTVGRRICECYPELANELMPQIEILVEQKVSAGIVNRGKKEMKKLAEILAD